MRILAALTAIVAVAAQDTGRKPDVRAAVEQLRGDEATAQEALLRVVELGEAAIPQLRASLEDEDLKFRRRVRTAMGRITGQWGSNGKLVWKRSLKEAQEGADGRKPLIVLQLFGRFDEEFC